MQFRVNLPLPGTDTSFNPAGTHPPLRATPIVNIKSITPNERRQLILVEEEGDTTNPDGPGSPVGDGDPVESLINNTKWNGNREGSTVIVPGSRSNGLGVSATETPRQGATELWEVANITGDAHPIHIHLIQFQVISRQTFDLDAYLTDWMATFPGGTFNGFTFPAGVYIPGFGPPLNYLTRNGAGAVGGNLNFNAAKYLQQGACAGGACPSRAPEGIDAGWKDTIKMFPGEITRLAVRWAPQGVPADGYQPGPGSVHVRSDEPARVRRALSHPGPRRQRVHEALAGDQVAADEALVADDERREGATGGGSAAGRQSSSIVGLRVLLLIAAAGAVVVAVTIAARGRGGDAAVHYACPMHPEVRGAGPANVRSVAWRWSASGSFRAR